MESNAGAQGIRKYRKIIAFSIVMCIITVAYNLVVLGIRAAIEIRKQLIAYSIITVFIMQEFSTHFALEFVNYSMHVIYCLKPCIVASAYLWVKCR